MTFQYRKYPNLGLELFVNNFGKINSISNCFILLSHEVDQISYEISPSSQARCHKLNKLVSFLDKDSYFIIFMGQGRLDKNFKHSIAECMFNYFSNNFFSPDFFILDKSSLDSVGDAVFSYNILQLFDFKGDINIITSDWHMNRVKLIFKKVYDKKYKLNFENTSDSSLLSDKTLRKINLKEKLSLRLFINTYQKYYNRNESLVSYLKAYHSLYN